MAHNNDYTHIYIDKSVTPNVGIDFDEVRKALNESTLDCGKLCTSNKINVWARYRPMLWLNNPELILKDQTVVGEGEHGQTIITQNDLDVFIVQEPITGYAQWESFRGPKPDPELGAYRIVDFDGYRHDAPCPFSSLNLPTVHTLGVKDTEADAGNVRVSISIDFNAQQYQGSVLLNDFILFRSSSNYLGFVFCKHSTVPFEYSNRVIVTDANPIQLSSAQPVQLYVDAPDVILAAGSWDCYAVLVVGQSYPSGASQSEISSITFYTLPLKRKTITIQQGQSTIVFSNTSVDYSDNNRYIDINFDVSIYGFDNNKNERYEIVGYPTSEGSSFISIESKSKDGTWPTPVGTNVRRTFTVHKPNPYYIELTPGVRTYLRFDHVNITYVFDNITESIDIQDESN